MECIGSLNKELTRWSYQETSRKPSSRSMKSVHEKERDALRFHWQPDANAEIAIYWFTRVLFGLAPSPFLLGGVLECHLDAWAEK